MIFEYRAVHDDGHLHLVSDYSPRLARMRARKTYPDSPLARMIDGWGSVNWDAQDQPRRFRAGWSSRGKVHATLTGNRALCGVALIGSDEPTPGRFTMRFDPDDADSCPKCVRSVLE